MSQKPKYTKHTAFVPKVTYEPVEGAARGLADVRNITVVRNDSDTYKVKVYNVEAEISMFPLLPEGVTCDPRRIRQEICERLGATTSRLLRKVIIFA